MREKASVASDRLLLQATDTSGVTVYRTGDEQEKWENSALRMIDPRKTLNFKTWVVHAATHVIARSVSDVAILLYMGTFLRISGGIILFLFVLIDVASEACLKNKEQLFICAKQNANIADTQSVFMRMGR